MDDLLVGLFSAPPGSNIALSDFALRLLVAWLLGTLVGWSYSWSHGVLSYSQNFVQSLVMLSMIVCVIMGVVGDSLARAFGLAAALAIVRFRTPVKDARDTTFLFLSVAIGMAAGAGQLAIAALSAVVICSLAWWLNWSAYGMRSRASGLLRFRFSGEDSQRDSVIAVIQQHCRMFELSAARTSKPGGPQELVYDVAIRGSAESFLQDLTATGLVSGVSLLPHARSGEG
jgi:hypothetical protein